MATTVNPREQKSSLRDNQLHRLLDGLELAQRQDIHAFSSGHLNEENLLKHSARASYKSWKSAKKPIESLKPAVTLPKGGQTKANIEEMKDALLTFSIGTAGNVIQKSDKSAHKRSPRKTPTGKELHFKDTKDASVGNKILLEELRPTEAVMAKSLHNGAMSPALDESVFDKHMKDPPDLDGAAVKAKLSRKPLSLCFAPDVIPSHTDAVTKRDQFKRMKQFESDILKKQDTMEQNVMSGMKAVEHLEARLREALTALRYDGYGPNFMRLQVYSDVCEDLVEESPTFSFILKEIKKEYDDYVASLLDGQTSKHHILQSQVKQLSDHSLSSGSNLYKEMACVSHMEDEAKRLLEENERLRKELEEEEQLAQEPEPEPPKKPHMFQEQPQPELTDQIEELHATILAELDELNDLRSKLRKECVPSTVCTHLEQCIKETEVEIQKLTSQKEFFDHSIAEMQTDLQNSIETADTTERDARRVWKKIMAVKQHTHGNRGGNRPANVFDSDDQEDENKWSWYIS